MRRQTLIDRVGIELTAPCGMLARVWEALTIAFFIACIPLMLAGIVALLGAGVAVWLDVPALFMQGCSHGT